MKDIGIDTLKIIEIREKNTQEVLFKGDFESLDRAYQLAAELEKMGAEIELIIPSAPKSLALALGMGQDEEEGLDQSILHEIESHE